MHYLLFIIVFIVSILYCYCCYIVAPGDMLGIFIVHEVVTIQVDFMNKWYWN